MVFFLHSIDRARAPARSSLEYIVITGGFFLGSIACVVGVLAIFDVES